MAQEATSRSCAAPLGELSACPTDAGTSKKVLVCEHSASIEASLRALSGGLLQALIHGNLRAKAAQDILSALDLLPFRGLPRDTAPESPQGCRPHAQHTPRGVLSSFAYLRFEASAS